MKCHVTDHGIGVMLIVRGPGGFDGGKVVDGLVSQMTCFLTICELAEIDSPDWLQGNSILPLVGGEVDDIRDAIFAEVNYHCCYEPQSAVRTKRWKYIRRYDDAKQWALPNCDDSISKSYMLESDWVNQPIESERLYDVVFDSSEAHNLAGNPDYADVLAEMRERLEQWRTDTADPVDENQIMTPPENGGVKRSG